jgi:glycosyltransferase involved in cell wall biosynthesis
MRSILVLATNLAQASFRVRIAALQPLLADRGFDLEICVRPRGWLASPSLKKKLRTARDYHAVIVQRKFLSPSEAAVLRTSARKIVYDIDDAMMHHNRDVGWISRWRTARNYAATTPILDHVVAGNEYLAGIFRAQGKSVTVIPTMLDSSRYQEKIHTPTTMPTLVWIGSRSTIPYLEQSLPALESAARQIPGLRLLTIANATVRSSVLQVEHIEWTEAGEAAALCKGDIGIAPTPSDPWTMGKCGFKILQYMASGLPVVASPVGANADIVHDGVTGVLATTPAQWVEAISQLAGDPNVRAAVGRVGRELATTRYTLQRAADDWAAILAV